MRWTIVSIGLLCSTTFAQSWFPRADFEGSARDDATAFSLGDYGYVVTGYQTGWIATNDGFKYHAYTDTWLPITPLPSFERQYSCAFTIGNKAYLVGGINGPTYFNDCWEYEPALDNWTQMASIPDSGIGTCVCFSLNGKGYIGTGLTTGDSIISSWWEYDPGLDLWSQMGDFPGTPRKLATGFALNGKGYVLIGIDSTDTRLKDVWEYDAGLDSWTQRNDFGGTPRFFAGGVSDGTSGYVVAGWDSLDIYRNDAWQYNPIGDSWQALDTIPASGRKGVSLFSLNSNIFLTTGVQQDGTRLTETWGLGETIGLEEYETHKIQIWPNPSNGDLNIRSEGLINTVCISDMQGRVIRDLNNLDLNELIWNLDDLSSGLYYITINAISTLKWVKN